jgi:MFS transporter, DHA2 family, multidrug resistance protein
MYPLQKNKEPMRKRRLLFKRWVPEWMIKVTLFIVLLPSLVLFFLPLANVNAAAGNTGIETYDVLYSVVLFYAGYTSFFSLERRFFSYLAAKEYFIVITFIQIISSYICYATQELAVLFIFRFIQGMAFTMTVNLSLSLIFMRLKSSRARAIGYSVFFGMLISTIPFNTFATAELVDSFNFNILYKCAMFLYLPSLALLLLILNNVRLNVKFPLYQLDWPSFFFYAAFLCLLGYVMVYGQNYYWLEDQRIYLSFVAIFILLFLFVLRQLHLKRPYFDLEVFRYRNFKVGLYLILIFYICRFAFGITTSYFQVVLKLDPIHIGYITLLNIFGIIVGVIVSCAYVLQQRPIRLLWIYGFSFLLIYHVWMIFLFNPQANEDEFYIPLIIQGLGVGILMTPTIIFVVNSVPEKLSTSSAGICLFIRCFGFYVSIALVNFFELFGKSKHYNTFQDLVTQANPVVGQTIAKHTQFLLSHGAAPDLTKKMTDKLLINSLNIQSQIRFSIDYYEMISCLLVFTLFLVALFPYINRTMLALKKNQPSPF